MEDRRTAVPTDAPVAALPAISPELVLVRPELRAAIQLSDASNKQMVFFGVPDQTPSVFTIAGKTNGVVQLVLTGGNFGACGPPQAGNSRRES